MKIIIDTNTVHRLITMQFPQWKNLSIKPVAHGGWDNRALHLGEKLLVRMPSHEKYAEKSSN